MGKSIPAWALPCQRRCEPDVPRIATPECRLHRPYPQYLVQFFA